jgi:hypothetical protein
MNIQHTVTRAIGIALLGVGAWAPAASGAGQARIPNNYAQPTGVTLKDGGLVEFCAEGAACRTGRHPIAAGDVRQIVPGDFISAAPASWIALSDRTVSLCYLAGSTSTVTCTPVANGSELAKGTQIAYVDLDDGTRTLKFTPKSGDKATREATFNPYPFMSGVSAAAEVLQKHAARHRSGNATYDNTVLEGGGDADVCAFVEGGMTCTSTGGEAARDDAHGGAYRAGPPAATIAARTRRPDPNAITTVYAGKNEQPTFRACTNAVIAQMKECNGSRNNMGEEANRACVANADTNLQECMAEVRYNANLNR